MAAPVSTRNGLNWQAWGEIQGRAQQVKNKRLPPPQSLDNQVLVESTGRLKGGRVEAESTGASVGRGHLGPFESSQTSLHLTCSSDEKLSSVSAGHKSPLGSSVSNWRKLLCVCVCGVSVLRCSVKYNAFTVIQAFPLIFDHTHYKSKG